MSNKEEDYLDNLLNSVSGGRREKDLEIEEGTRENSSLDLETDDDISEKDFLGLEGDDFLKAIEEELGKEDADRYLREFEQELQFDEQVRMAKDLQDSYEPEDILDGALAQMMDEDQDGDSTEDLLQSSLMDEDTSTEEPLADGDASTEGALMDGDVFSEEAFGGVDALEGFSDMGGESLGEDMSGEEVPLSGNETEDLMSLLAGDDDLADLSSLLDMSEGTGDAPLDGGEAFQEFAQKEMENQEALRDGEAPLTEDSDKKPKKPGFFKRLLQALFKEHVEEVKAPAEKVDVSASQGPDAKELSDENLAILQELEGANLPGKEEKKGKEKKKKEKKPKEKKPKKAKAPKEQKPKKPKKEKKPFFNDQSKPLPKVPVLLIFAMVLSAMLLVLVTTELTGYQTAMKKAEELYNNGASDYHCYIEAYKAESGLKESKKDQDTYQKIVLVAQVADAYAGYEMAVQLDRTVDAVDSLVCVIGRYNQNIEKAEELGAKDQMDQVRALAAEKMAEYGLSEEDASKLYQIRTRSSYSVELHKKLQELGIE
ncbi:MAG: hypothetical protein MR356_03175 [Agathobacter sp.]|nr:hypothetical protein [Agathobacter sp.]